MNSSPVNLRNLERIQEGTSGSTSKWATLLLAASGSAAVLVAAWVLKGREGPPQTTQVDQLAVLVAEAQNQKQERDPTQLDAKDLGFPQILSDADQRTTALVAVKGKDGRLVVPSAPDEEAAPRGEPDWGQLPVSPLPAGSLLHATSVTHEPQDELMQLAVRASEVSSDAPLAEPGSEGGFLIQVASFKKQEDADRFVTDLRKRGHRAFRQAANVPGRGLWHRVRIGSFKNKYEATLYKKKLEDAERIVALVIDPDKVERQEQVRAAKLAERIRKSGSKD